MKLQQFIKLGICLGGLALGTMGAVCNPESDFACIDTEACVEEAGAGAVCEANSFCSVPDVACEEGRRWHRRAGPLGGRCLEGGVAGSDTDEMTTGAATGPMGTTSGEGPGVGTTTDPTADPTADPTNATTSPPPTTGDGGTDTGDPGSEGAGAQGCDEKYGGADGYLLCEESEDACSFKVDLLMTLSCADVCEAAGGDCVGAQWNDADPCGPSAESTCDDTSSNDAICHCSR